MIDAPTIKCEACLWNGIIGISATADGFAVQALPIGPNGECSTRFKAVCGMHRTWGSQFIPLHEGWRQYTIQEVMLS